MPALVRGKSRDCIDHGGTEPFVAGIVFGLPCAERREARNVAGWFQNDEVVLALPEGPV